MKKKTIWEKTERFLAGKGFYVVLAACAVVIGVSAWIMLVNSGNQLVEQQEASQTITGLQPVQEPSRWETAQPVSVPEDEPETVPVTAPAEPVQPTREQELQAQEEDSEHTSSSEQSFEQTGFVWPVTGQIVAAFSPQELVYSKTMRDWRTHPAVDIAAEIGTRVLAAARGTVLEIRQDDLYGTTLVIEHGGGLRSVYSNLAAQPAVSVGDSVAMGAVIGAVGDTAIGESVEASHLHFAMTLDGEPVDPADYLP